VNPTAQLLQPEVQELIAEGRYLELREALHSVPAADVADLLAELEPADAAVTFRFLARDEAGDVFSNLEPETQEALIETLGAEASQRVFEAMEPDDRVALMDELPDTVARRLLNALSPENRRETQMILGYPPDSVGRLMTPDYVKLRPLMTIAQALEHIRMYGRDAETVHWVYIVDADGKLIDDIHSRTLLLADPEANVESVMDDKFIAAEATDDQEEVVLMMGKYDRTALPVVDSRGALLGIVTIDDVADIAEEEATEDIQKIAGVEALERPYMQTHFGEMLKKRGGTLCILFVFQLLTIGVMSYFDEHLHKALVLALFVPLIISSGGNTGTQAASLLIRALALRELEPSDWWSVLKKELSTGIVLGLVLGSMGVLTVLLLGQIGVAPSEYAWGIAISVGIAIVGIVLWAGILGSMFPLVLSKLGLDPATISSPLVATLMDVSGLVIYFTVAIAILKGTLL